jgi:gluconolactonase
MSHQKPPIASEKPPITPARAASLALLVALIAAAVWLLAPQGSIPGVVAPGVKAKLVHDGFKFLEGPVGTADGGLYFTDLPPEKIYRLDPGGQISLTREHSGKANGLVATEDGGLLAAEMNNKRISKWSGDGTATTLTDNIGGKPYMAPNDLIADARGGIYFTDPGPFGQSVGKTYVYYLPPDQDEPMVIDDQITKPNGIMLSPDGKTLFVSDTSGEAVFAYDVQPNGAVEGKRIFARLRDIPAGQASGADGMAVDRDGRLYVTTMTGVQVFDANGEHLGTIDVPNPPTNVAFSGPHKRTLYVTARQGLYSVEMLAQGPDRFGK